MDKNKVINLNEYKNRKLKENNINGLNKFRKLDEDDRKNTFNLFMRVLSTMREESY